MVRFVTKTPSGVVISEVTRSRSMSGGNVSRCVPLTLHRVVPPLVLHVKTAGLFRKTVELSGAWRISGVERKRWQFLGVRSERVQLELTLCNERNRKTDEQHCDNT